MPKPSTREEATTSRPLTIAVPKGRILQQLVPRLSRSGTDVQSLLDDDRTLIRMDDAGQLRFLLLKPDDVPTYVEYGVADLGIVGRDSLQERGGDVYIPLDLEIGRCHLAVAGKKGQPLREREDGRPLRVGTKFTGLAQQHFKKKGWPIETVYLQGSVELAPLVGLTDVIVDLVESGRTLEENGLEEFETIQEVSTVVIANRVAMKLHQTEIQRFLKALTAGAAS